MVAASRSACCHPTGATLVGLNRPRTAGHATLHTRPCSLMQMLMKEVESMASAAGTWTALDVAKLAATLPDFPQDIPSIGAFDPHKPTLCHPLAPCLT